MAHFPGIRLRPYEDEIVGSHLYLKLKGRASHEDTPFNEINIYDYDPWMLRQHSKVKSRDPYWLFFCPLGGDGDGDGSKKQRRSTSSGFWKSSGDPKVVYDRWGYWTGNQGIVIGYKKFLRFHIGKTVNPGKGDWIMHEFHNTMVPPNMRTHVVCKIKYMGNDLQFISDNTTEAGPSNSAADHEVNYASTNETQHFSANLNTQEQQVVVPALNQNEMQMPYNYLPEEDYQSEFDAASTRYIPSFMDT